jgi:hypothetical protein
MHFNPAHNLIREVCNFSALCARGPAFWQLTGCAPVLSRGRAKEKRGEDAAPERREP